MKLSDFNYNLPQNFIAQKPTKPRDHCRLLILDRETGDIKHKKFFEISQFIKNGDVLVFNDSKVIPARLHGNKITGLPSVALAKEGGNVEILLIKKISSDTWEALLKNFKEKEFGKKIIIAKNFIASPEKNIDGGLWQIKFNQLAGGKDKNLDKLIYKYGQTPLPPYIKKMAKLSDYQTIYAKREGSVAAPTAGLHFTKKLLNSLKKQGAKLETITLHIGLGTFAPIKDNNIEKHKIHSEYAEISAKTAKAINKARSEGRRIIAVGTTSARTLEAFAMSTDNQQQTSNNKNKQKFRQSDDRQTGGILPFGKMWVDIFIKPGYKFKIVDGMITNFHLPETTLMILVSAFAGRPAGRHGRKNILKAYQEAINKKYKFFSFGDAMLII